MYIHITTYKVISNFIIFEFNRDFESFLDTFISAKNNISGVE